MDSRVLKNIEEVSRFSLAALSTQDHLLATISAIVKSVADLTRDADVQPEVRDRVVTQVFDSTAQLLDSVGMR